MPTDKTDDATAQGDGAAERTPGIPDPTPLVPENPQADASTEPAQAAVAEAADQTVAPPLPADYEMPDDYADEDPVAKVKAWVEANPGLAIVGAAGVGLLAGRLVTALLPDPEPASLADRVESRARTLRKQAKKKGKKVQAEAASYANTAGDTLQDSLHRAAEALKDAASKTASTAGDYAEDGYEKSRDLAETIADAAKVAVTGVLATKVDDWMNKIRD